MKVGQAVCVHRDLDVYGCLNNDTNNMIREIINFTRDLLEDFPDILQWNAKPNGGLYVFVHLDNEGHWDSSNLEYGKDYFYISGNSSEPEEYINKAMLYEEQVKRVGTTMNKVLDKKKQIFSCSPFAVTFKKKSFTNDKLEGDGHDKIRNLLPEYFCSARQLCKNKDTECQYSIGFESICGQLLHQLEKLCLPSLINEKCILEYMKDDEFINLFLDNVSVQTYKQIHDVYLQDRLFNSNDYNEFYSEMVYGLSGFLNGLNSKKTFLAHKTGVMSNGISGRITSTDALHLSFFETLIINGTLPNPLPVVIDKKEINGQIVSVFNKKGKKGYCDILKSIFESKNLENLSDYYLLNYSKRKSFVINDIDFVPLFRFNLTPITRLKNLFGLGRKKDNEEFVYDPDIILSNIFDFERVVVKEIFNNSLFVENDKGMKVRYFDDIDSSYVRGGDLMYQLILKYRKAFYDYIYKSKQNALNVLMFDDMMFTSILSNIRMDEIKGRFSNNPAVKKKLNIWFSLHFLFGNTNYNINTDIMASKITDLITKMRQVSKGEAIIETPEEFAFAAGQLVSYLIDRSVTSNKTYSLLEPYLQKTKSGYLQDAIAHTVSVYKHDISTYKGSFQQLASNVLTCEGDLEMKPLLKFFLAGCFSHCVIYDKKDNN